MNARYNQYVRKENALNRERVFLTNTLAAIPCKETRHLIRAKLEDVQRRKYELDAQYPDVAGKIAINQHHFA